MRSLFPSLLHGRTPSSRNRPGQAPQAPFQSGAVRDTWRARDGTAITLRAARPADRPLIQELVRGLSARSRYQRFFYPARELPADLLDRFTRNAAQEAMTLLAVIRHQGREQAVAMAQYVVVSYPQHCDFAVVVADAWQRAGLGTKLIQTLGRIARAAGIERIEGDMLAENEAMLRLALRLGFTLTPHEDGAYLLKVSQQLSEAELRRSSPAALAGDSRQPWAIA